VREVNGRFDYWAAELVNVKLQDKSLWCVQDPNPPVSDFTFRDVTNSNVTLNWAKPAYEFDEYRVLHKDVTLAAVNHNETTFTLSKLAGDQYYEIDLVTVKDSVKSLST
jgi:hypothetical protein